MKKLSLIICAVLSMALSMTLTSCQSKEEKVIESIEKLSERIEKEGADYSIEEWEGVMKECEQIHAEMKECNFTDEQMEKVGEADAHLTTVIAKEGTKKLGNELKSIIGGVGSFMKGFKKGAKDNLNEELKGVTNGIEEGLNSILEGDE